MYNTMLMNIRTFVCMYIRMYNRYLWFECTAVPLKSDKTSVFASDRSGKASNQAEMLLEESTVECEVNVRTVRQFVSRNLNVACSWVRCLDLLILIMKGFCFFSSNLMASKELHTTYTRNMLILVRLNSCCC